MRSTSSHDVGLVDSARLLFTAVGVSGVAMATLAAQPEPRIAEATRHHAATAFDAKRDELRERFLGDFRKVDRRPLLRLKERVDSLLAACMLVEDATTRPAWAWWSLPTTTFREDETSGPCRDEATTVDPIGTTSHVAARTFNGRLEWLAPSGEGPPLTLWISGTVGRDAGDIQIHHYEPYLANRLLGLPLHPEQLTLRWSPSRLQLLANAGGRLLAEELAGERPPILNNPPTLYCFFDTLRAKMNAGPGAWREEQTMVAADGTDWRVVDRHGEEIRIARVRGTSDSMEVEIRQRPVRLLHRSSLLYLLANDVAKDEPEIERYTPGVDVEYLEGGRVISIALTREAGAWFPHRATVSCDGILLFESVLQPGPQILRDDPRRISLALSTLEGLYAALHDRVTPANVKEYGVEEVVAAGPHLRRAMLKYNIYASLHHRDMRGLETWLDHYHAMLLAERVSHRFHVLNVEAIAHVACGIADPAFAAEVVDGPLRRAYEQSDPAELAEHAARLVSQYKAGLALVALDVLADLPNAELASWAQRLGGSLRVAMDAGEIERDADHVDGAASDLLTRAIIGDGAASAPRAGSSNKRSSP